MNKLLLAILVLPIVTFASTTPLDPEKEGLPLPDGGIKVVSMKKTRMLTKSANTILIAQQQIKTKGFYEIDNPEAKILMNMRNIKPLKAGENKPEDTNLKSNIADIGLAFEFNGVPVEQKNVVGYAAAGSYDKGWTGATEIFTDLELGTCQYTINNIKLSHGSEFVPQEIARKDINGKVTTVDVRGNIKSGYTYTIHWADNNAMNDLQCANTTFAKSNTDKLIKLAKKIDKSVIIK